MVVSARMAEKRMARSGDWLPSAKIDFAGAGFFCFS